MNDQNNNKRKKSSAILMLIGIVLVVCSAVYLAYTFYGQYMASKEDETLSSIVSTDTTKTLADNPIDFDTLKSTNKDIYAYIKIDDTDVDYPIVQSPDNDNFYLKHRASDKKYSSSGAIYTELHNTKTFNDSVTVIYGHNGYGDTMFTTLHKFEKKEFFDSHEYYYIFTQDRRIKVQIISAFKYDDRHILNAFDFQNTQILEDFENMLKDPKSSVKNVRNNLDTSLDKDSKLVVLSTCITNQKSSRYLVCGVIVNNEQTN